MSNMLEFINELWFLKRDIVSDDFDRALYRLAEEAPMTHPRISNRRSLLDLARAREVDLP